MGIGVFFSIDEDWRPRAITAPRSIPGFHQDKSVRRACLTADWEPQGNQPAA
jgi:hypothetical protein